MPIGTFKHPTLGAIAFEFVNSRDSDIYITTFEPDHEDYPERVDADDAPEDWHRLAEAQIPLAIAEANTEGY